MKGMLRHVEFLDEGRVPDSVRFAHLVPLHILVHPAADRKGRDPGMDQPNQVQDHKEQHKGDGDLEHGFRAPVHVLLANEILKHPVRLSEKVHVVHVKQISENAEDKFHEINPW